MTSVIIPCYNVENVVRQTIESVVSQSDSDWEIVVVDDGSTDSTPDVLSGLAESDSRIRVIRQDNKGVSAARNIGLSQARGEWIYFLDGDDLIDSDLIRHVNSNSRKDLDMLVFNFQREERGAVKRVYKVSDLDSLFKDYLTNRQSIHISSIAVKREFIQSNSILFDEATSYGEDREFVAKLFLNSPKSKLLDRILFRYQCREGSAMTSCRYDGKRFSSVLACERTYRSLIGRPEERKALAILAFTIARHAKMYYDFNAGDEEIEKKLKDYSARYLKGVHFYGFGHVELYTSLAGIFAVNSLIFRLFLKLL